MGVSRQHGGHGVRDTLDRAPQGARGRASQGRWAGAAVLETERLQPEEAPVEHGEEGTAGLPKSLGASPQVQVMLVRVARERVPEDDVRRPPGIPEQTPDLVHVEERLVELRLPTLLRILLGIAMRIAVDVVEVEDGADDTLRTLQV